MADGQPDQPLPRAVVEAAMAMIALWWLSMCSPKCQDAEAAQLFWSMYAAADSVCKTTCEAQHGMRLRLVHPAQTDSSLRDRGRVAPVRRRVQHLVK